MKGTFLAAGGDSEGSEKIRSLQREENSEEDDMEEQRMDFVVGFSRDLRAMVIENGGAVIILHSYIMLCRLPQKKKKNTKIWKICLIHSTLK